VALAATLTFSSGTVLAVGNDVHQDRTELRIKDMHAKLKITSAQEEQWSKVAQAMKDNAKVMDTLTQARFSHMKEMTAIDDLRSYGEISDAHADGIKQLTPVFATLYESMSAAQKKEADTLFRHGDRKHGHEMAHSNK
jgi:glutamine synthetase adenylyltransferase